MAEEGVWRSDLPDTFRIEDQVHVWRIPLVGDAALLGRLTAVLDAAEKQRVNRFVFAADRRRYLLSHAALRLILSNYLPQEPDMLIFGLGAYGKPYLQSSGPGYGLQFNLTHTPEMALIAVTGSLAVGIDIEQVRPLDDALAIADRFFSAEEIADLRTVAGTTFEAQAFFNCWTRKEAIIKAQGAGLSRALDSFAVTLLPDEAVVVRRDDQRPASQEPWHLRALHPGPNYAAALAVENAPQSIQYWTWSWTA